MRAFLILLVLSIAAPLRAQAVRTWVDPDGLDTNPCSKAQPCRNFSAAVAAVSSGGEVVVLSAGGFGAVTIDKSVSIIGPQGVHAAIAPTSGSAITIQNVAGDTIHLRGLYLNSQGAIDGITISGGEVHVEDMVISGFNHAGIFSFNTELFVSDTTIRQGADILAVGIYHASSTLNRAVIERVHTSDCGVGIYAVSGSRMTIRDSVATNHFTGYWADAYSLGTSAEMTVDNCVLVAQRGATGFGVYAGGSESGATSVTVTHTTATGFQAGAVVYFTDGGSILRVAHSTFINNQVGLLNNGGTLESRGNNLVRGNGMATSGTITPLPGF